MPFKKTCELILNKDREANFVTYRKNEQQILKYEFGLKQKNIKMRKPLIEIEVDGIQLPNLEEQSAKNKENNKSNKSTGNLDFLNKGEHTIDNSYGSLEGQLENPKKSNSTDANQLTNNLSTGVVYSELLSDEEIHRFLNEAEKANMNFTDNWSSNFSIIAGGLGELKDHEIEQFLNDFLLECTTYIDNFS